MTMRLTTALLLACLLASCGGGGGGNPGPGDGDNNRFILTGTVTDGNGAALAGVDVLLSLNPTVTDSSGRFSYENLPAGSYVVSLQDAQGNYDSRNVTIAAGSTDFSFSLPSTDGLRIVSTDPPLNSSGVSLDGVIELEFSTAPDPPSVTAGDFEITPPVGDLSLSLNGNILRITPREQLPPGQNMLLEYVGEVNDGLQSMQQPLRLRFTTSSTDSFAPRLVGTRPPDAATNHPPNVAVSFDFNEALDADTSLIAVTSSPAASLSLRISGSSLLVSAQGGWQELTDYTVTAMSVSDLEGNTSAVQHEISFRTSDQAVNASNREADWNLDNGLIVFSSNLNGGYDIFSIRPDGTELTQLTALPGDERHPSLSADGSLLAFQKRDNEGFWQVLLLPLDEQFADVQTLTSPGYHNTEPYFSRTFSNEIVFTSTRQSVTGLWSVNADNLLEVELDESFGSGQSEGSFHPLIDGQLLFSSGRSGNQDIWRKTVSVISGETINLNLTDQLLSREHSSAWSPDASFFVFISDFDGTDNLWIGDITGDLHTQLTYLDAGVADPVIDPVLANNRCLVTISNGSGGSDLVLVDLTNGEILSNLTGV